MRRVEWPERSEERGKTMNETTTDIGALELLPQEEEQELSERDCTSWSTCSFTLAADE